MISESKLVHDLVTYVSNDASVCAFGDGDYVHADDWLVDLENIHNVGKGNRVALGEHLLSVTNHWIGHYCTHPE